MPQEVTIDPSVLFQRGSAEGPNGQLPFGEAAGLNDQLQVAADLQASQAAVGEAVPPAIETPETGEPSASELEGVIPADTVGLPPEGVSFGPGANEVPFEALSEDDQLMAFAPQGGLPYLQGAVSRNAIPDEIYQAIPVILEAAKMPNPSPAMRQLLRLISYEVTK